MIFVHKLFESELKIMDVLWQEGALSAKQLAEIMYKQVGWKKTTTYTVLKKCIDKGVVGRQEPNFVCHPLLTKEQAREAETTELINKLYNGAADQLVATILGSKRLSPEELARLKQLVKTLE